MQYQYPGQVIHVNISLQYGSSEQFLIFSPFYLYMLFYVVLGFVTREVLVLNVLNAVLNFCEIVSKLHFVFFQPCRGKITIIGLCYGAVTRHAFASFLLLHTTTEKRTPQDS